MFKASNPPATPQPAARELTLLLADGLNMVRRIYEGIKGPDSADKAKGCVKSSIASFRRALSEHNPTHALAAFDHSGPTWHHALYEAYKQGRTPMPAELRAVIPEIMGEIESLGIKCIAQPGVEADDVIAAVFRRWARSNKGPVIILSTDKDMSVLVAEGALVRDHFNNEWRDEAWIKAKFGVPATLLQDFFALMGDASDGIPGVEKVGSKTAAKWLLECGSLDAVIESAAMRPGKVGKNLREQADVARLSRQLVDFRTDMELGLTWNAIKRPVG